MNRGLILGCAIVFSVGVGVWRLTRAPNLDPLIQRLDRAQPVHFDEVEISDVTLRSDRVIATAPPLRFPLGQPLRIRGRIRPGTWKLSGLSQPWGPDAATVDKVVAYRPQEGDRVLHLFVFVYSGRHAAPEIEFRHVLQVKPLEEGFEFRIEIPGPAQPGEYVADLFLEDRTEPARRGEESREFPGISVWRSPFFVE